MQQEGIDDGMLEKRCHKKEGKIIFLEKIEHCYSNVLYNYDSKRETKTKAIWLSYHVQDACMGHLCENGGTCDIQNENVTCVCTPFYGGARCEKQGTM